MITFEIEDNAGSKTVEVPEDINLSLMEVLKASGCDVLATCGGMALCATCHVEVTRGKEALPAPNEMELDMLDTLPNANACSRLACQIKIGEHIQGASFILKGGE